MANNNGYEMAPLVPEWVKNECRIIMRMMF